MQNECRQHIGLDKDINILLKWKHDMVNPDGTIEHIWGSINKKISLALSITLMSVILGILTITFSLLYNTQQATIKQLSAISTSVAVIESTLGIYDFSLERLNKIESSLSILEARFESYLIKENKLRSDNLIKKVKRK